MNVDLLIGIDRQVLGLFNGSHSLFLDGVMSAFTSGFTWVPMYVALLFLIIKNNETMSQILLTIGCCALCLLLADGLSDLIVKPMTARPRPSNEPMIKYAVDVVNQSRGRDFSFFSAHAANTFSIAIFFSLLVRSKVLGTCLILWSLVNCYTRLYLGLHYPSDIIVGLTWGTIVGIGVYLIYKKTSARLNLTTTYISTQYTSTGYTSINIDVVVDIMMFTLFYVVMRGLITCI